MKTEIMLSLVGLALLFYAASARSDGPAIGAPPRHAAPRLVDTRPQAVGPGRNQSLRACVVAGAGGGRWWLWTDLNCRPNDYESFALTN